MYHTIFPIFNGFFSVDLANIFNIPASSWPFNPHVQNSPSFIFLIVDEQGSAILVDTGFSKDYIFGFPPFSSCLRDYSDEIPQALKSRGFQPEDIEQVIITHIHWDHTGGMRYFPNSTFFVQAEDFRALINLRPHEETGFCPSHWFPCLDRIKLVDGVMELKPGIKLILSGGHTSGHQLVEVETRAGRVLLGGDIRFDYSPMWRLPNENWDFVRLGQGKHMFWDNKVLPALKEWLKKNNALTPHISLITQTSEPPANYCEIVFSHDPRLLTVKSIP